MNWKELVCDDKSVQTPIGKLHAIEISKTFEHAIEYCTQHNQTLASFHDKKLLEHVAEYIKTCLHDRKNAWNVGLKLDDGAGMWVDGTVYNPLVHRQLFSNTARSIPNTCRIPSLVPFMGGELQLYRNCGNVFRFFCADDKATITPHASTTTTTTTTTTTATTGSFTCSVVETGDVAREVVPLVICVLLFIALIFVFFKYLQATHSSSADEGDPDPEEERMV